VLLGYCDFGVDWSFAAFSKWLRAGDWDCAMTAYKGFHPHSLGPTLYAYMRNEGDQVTEIREKFHFTENKFAEYASSGLYWFRHGRDLKRIAAELVLSGERVNGEYYVSMAVQRLVSSGGRVGVYELAHFYQWGTPEDLRDYEGWALAMRRLEAFCRDAGAARSNASLVVPMAGRGQRFVDQGYAVPKALIDVSGRPMVVQAMACLPRTTSRVLVALSDHVRELESSLRVCGGGAATRIVRVDQITQGQACTAGLATSELSGDRPVLIAPCDTGCVYDVERWTAIERAAGSPGADGADLIVFTARGHLPALWRPSMYGWAAVTAEGRVAAVRVKELVPDIAANDQEVIVGTFWFRDVATYNRELKAMIAADDRVRGEYYVDTIARRMVEKGARVRAFSVDKYMPWGTPEELKTFFYWNDVFRGGAPFPQVHV